MIGIDLTKIILYTVCLIRVSKLYDIDQNVHGCKSFVVPCYLSEPTHVYVMFFLAVYNTNVLYSR